jgi:cysteine synthase A
LSKGTSGSHKIQALVPDLSLGLNTTIYDEVIDVTDADAFAIVKKSVIRRYSGRNLLRAAVWAAIELAKRPENKGKTIVTLLPDTGDRYSRLHCLQTKFRLPPRNGLFAYQTGNFATVFVIVL